MAKKNALAKTEELNITSTFTPYGWSVKDGKFSLSADFHKEVAGAAGDIGIVLVTAQSKVRTGLNLTMAFDAWKKLDGGGLPKFVKLFFDRDCPESAGSKGSANDKQLKANATFSGIEYMVKNARRRLIAMNEVKALRDAGIDVSTEEKLKAAKSEARKQQTKTELETFCDVIVGIDEKGITPESISDILIYLLKKKVKGKNELSDVGTKWHDAAKTAVMVARGEKATAAKNITPKK